MGLRVVKVSMPLLGRVEPALVKLAHFDSTAPGCGYRLRTKDGDARGSAQTKPRQWTIPVRIQCKVDDVV
jgi:hypothetical protein